MSLRAQIGRVIVSIDKHTTTDKAKNGFVTSGYVFLCANEK